MLIYYANITKQYRRKFNENDFTRADGLFYF